MRLRAPGYGLADTLIPSLILPMFEGEEPGA